MLIEQTPDFIRKLIPGAVWRLPQKEKTVYLTFDDGPIPEVTPWVLDLLKKYNIKATFFCVGDNVRKYPEVFKMVVSAGHSVGNHTFNHLQGFKVRSGKYVENVELADSYIRSNLFRPPHGHLRIRQGTKLSKKFRFVMWDVITRDYNMKLSGEYVLNVVKRYARNGSIIVFHDSIKAEENMKYALPKAIEFLLSEGYKFEKITEEEILKAI
ncbi:MAG: polysaccharide deacetylase family protein [Paludibacteraceae bacterium]|jgi:peptidoglycan/xylan/chitin deacetylase (PgdA/CDA1 family)|nr:polysaccharide deacetylase family protein [Paludibacteraceae bacterium]MBO5863657.1 polysaccharide deacetylase family protein [Paludibacteraceae bacterium]MBO5988067.1 polysaccharide deacetylase family protein [Paludibacteraceae bacterium]